MRAVCAGLWGSLLLGASCGGGEAPKDPHLLHWRLQSLPREGTPSVWREGLPLQAVLGRLRQASQDEAVRGLFLEVQPLGGQFARLSEIRAALGAWRRRGKKVHCHFDQADNGSYWLMAQVCDQLSMGPGGLLDFTGLALTSVYFGQLLERLAIDAEVIQVGRYKGAGDMFTRARMAPWVRRSLQGLVDELQARVTLSTARARRRSGLAMRRIMDRGPLSAQVAKALGMVDAVHFADAARALALRQAKVKRLRPMRAKSGEGAARLRQLWRGLRAQAPSGSRLLVAHVTGTLVDAGSSDGERTAAEDFVAQMRQARDDDEVRGVVLRIHSPGGSALASDRMWHAVYHLAKKKPVAVSIGDMAASGGYYVASAGRRIFAHGASILGSIGVVGGKVHLGRATDKLGIHMEMIEGHPHAGWSSPARPLSDVEHTQLTRLFRGAYARFLHRIARGRDLTRAQIRPLAAGRLFTGVRAKKGGLVDALGGLDAALAWTRKAAKAPDDVTLVHWPAPKAPWHALRGWLSAEAPPHKGLRWPAGAQLPATVASRHHLSSDDLRWLAALYGWLSRPQLEALHVLPWHLAIR
ncbi:MAG: signal peptide peptidase SppA [Polyangiales bacterium]